MAELADIDRIRAGADRLGELLLELELDGDRQLLDGARLKGVTANRWSAVDLLAAWEAHARLTAALESGSRDDLEALLEPALRTALQASAIVQEAGAAWATLTPRLAAAGDAIEAGGLERPRAAYERLSAELAADPLSVDTARVDALEQAVEDARRELADLAGLRAEAAARIAAARALMERVEAAQRDGETAHRLVLAKIAHPEVPAPRRALSEMAVGLREIESLVERREWESVRDALAGWTGHATAELERALAVAAANRAPIERRNHLRGLLKAYQGKARSRRLLEDREIGELFRRAEHELYTAPTDLRAATELITRYQEVLR
jgi:hypothetical protein